MPDGIEERLQEAVYSASQSQTPLAIFGGNTKSFYGRNITGDPLSVADHTGIIDYQPTELVLTARAGTPLLEIQDALKRNDQMLGFEPPAFGPAATLGGVVASGLAGPARPYHGSVSDFVLGVKVLSGSGEVLCFGGQVIKNVAGFDVSRLIAGSMGCLGVLLEISLKVLPQPAFEVTLVFAHDDPNNAIAIMNKLAGKPCPLTAAMWVNGETRVRLSGSEVGVQAASAEIGGIEDKSGAPFWESIREQQHHFFSSDQPLLRGSVKPATEMIIPELPQLIDWGGGLRWYCGIKGAEEFSSAIRAVGGSVTRFRPQATGVAGDNVFEPMNPTMMQLHKRLKNTFDPMGILNPGRMYAEL